MTTSFVYFYRKSTDLSWEGDEPSATVVEEEVAPPIEESTPAPQVESEVPAAEAALPEASVVEGKYSAVDLIFPHRVVVVADDLDFFLSGVEAEGSDIPAAVPMEKSTPQAPEAAEGAPEPMQEVAGEAAAAIGGEEATVPPEVALEVAIRSPEIQDAEPIRSAPMTEAAASSRGGVELLADDLVDPATVARHLDAVRQAEQWMKVSSRSF
jgi:hypothetical protein